MSERNGVVYVDGKRLREPYVPADRRDRLTGGWTVGKNGYFVLGDNRTQSCDSRVWGSVPRMNVVGRLVGIYWPDERFRRMRG